jgi:predicted Na+-dependent transporter
MEDKDMAIVKIIQNTPVWVWFVFLYLIISGVSSTKKRKAHIAKLFVLPCVFLFLFVFNLIQEHTIRLFGICMVLFASGYIFSFILMRKCGITKVEEHSVILEGSFNGLILSLLVFSTKYFFSYKRAVDSYYDSYIVIENAIYSILTGISAGILTLRLLEYKRLKKEINILKVIGG